MSSAKFFCHYQNKSPVFRKRKIKFPKQWLNHTNTCVPSPLSHCPCLERATTEGAILVADRRLWSALLWSAVGSSRQWSQRRVLISFLLPVFLSTVQHQPLPPGALAPAVGLPNTLSVDLTACRTERRRLTLWESSTTESRF